MPTHSMIRRMRTLLSGLLMLFMIGFMMNATTAYAERSLISVAKQAKWRKLFTQNGVTLFCADRDGVSLPLLKGQGLLNHNLYELMAIVEDAKRHTEWVKRMKKSVIFTRPDPFHLKSYIQLDFPWPAYDRDSVLEVEVQRKWMPHHEVWILFKRITDPRYPERKDLVRVVQSRGYTRLRWISPTQTEITYVIDSDPGGNLPRWLVRWISKKLPYTIIMALRKRVVSVRGQYERFLDRWDPRRTHQDDAPAQFTLPGVTQLAK